LWKQSSVFTWFNFNSLVIASFIAMTSLLEKKSQTRVGVILRLSKDERKGHSPYAKQAMSLGQATAHASGASA